MGVGGQRQVPVALPSGMYPDTHCTGGWAGPRPVFSYVEQGNK